MRRDNLFLKGEEEVPVSTNVFGLNQLFYLPLKAVIDANTQAALAGINIIREYGFDNDKSSENYGKLKMVTFSYDYIGKTGQLQTMSISIPFITLIPLPILEVKEAEIGFALKVLGQLDIIVDESDLQENFQNLMAVFAPNKSDTSVNLSVEANMNVNIKVGQSDFPGGILQLLNIGQEATMGGNLFDLSSQPNMLYFNKEEKLTLKVRYEVDSNLRSDIIFDISVRPSYKPDEAPFDQPIEIIEGNLYGKATWRHIRVIPTEGFQLASFELQFSAGKEISNGFIVIHSNYSNERKIYYSIS